MESDFKSLASMFFLRSCKYIVKSDDEIYGYIEKIIEKVNAAFCIYVLSGFFCG